MTALQYFGTLGAGPAHVIADTARNVVYAANYGGGTWSAFKTDADGVLTDTGAQSYAFDFFTGFVPGRQDAPHPHEVVLFKDNIYVMDLGGDRIYHYTITDEGMIVYDHYYEVEEGSGPRHMLFDESANRGYLLNELKQTINVYEVEADDGHLTLLGVVPIEIEGVTPDPSKQTQAEIQLSNDGQNLYISSRGQGTIIKYAVTADEPYLTEEQEVTLAGTWPRHFILTEDGKYLFVTSKWEDLLSVYNVAEDGSLSFEAAITTISLPTITQFVK